MRKVILFVPSLAENWWQEWSTPRGSWREYDISWQRYRYYDFFPRSAANKAKGGIKAQSKRGAFDQSWSDSALTHTGRSGLLK